MGGLCLAGVNGGVCGRASHEGPQTYWSLQFPQAMSEVLPDLDGSDGGCPGQVLFSGDHLAADSVAEWNARFEVNDDGFLGISRNFNCESSLLPGTAALWVLTYISAQLRVIVHLKRRVCDCTYRTLLQKEY